MLLAVADQHLRSGRQHAQECTTEKCAPDCGVREYEELLDAPMTKAEVVAEKRREANLAALMRGEIPA